MNSTDTQAEVHSEAEDSDAPGTTETSGPDIETSVSDVLHSVGKHPARSVKSKPQKSRSTSTTQRHVDSPSKSASPGTAAPKAEDSFEGRSRDEPLVSEHLEAVASKVAVENKAVVEPLLSEIARLADEALASSTRPAGRQRVSTAEKTAYRHLNGAAALLSFSVLADSALEHYRGGFYNRVMYVAPTISAVTLGASGSAIVGWFRDVPQKMIFGTAGVTGLVGVGVHVYNTLERIGEVDWENLFYGAPLGAPLGITFAGLTGLGAGYLLSPGRSRKTSFLGHLISAGNDGTYISDAIGAESETPYEAAIQANYPMVANAVIEVDDFFAAIDSGYADRGSIQEGDIVRGSDHKKIGTVEEVVEGTGEQGGYMLVPQGMIFETDTYIPLESVVKRVGNEVFINLPTMVVGMMPWGEPISLEDVQEKSGPQSGDVIHLYRLRSPSSQGVSA